MGTPRRHGLDWPQVPVPARRLEGGSAAAAATAAKTVAGLPAPRVGVVPVEILQAFYQALPPYGVQHFALTNQITYRQIEFITNVVATLMFVDEVPDGMVFVITDVVNFMTVPGAALNSPEQTLDDYSLLGLLRIQLVFSDRIPMRFEAHVISPNWPAAGVPFGLQTGWPILNEQFGARRAGGFAVYARSRQSVALKVYPDDVPQFLTSRFGAHMHGFSVPEATFEEIFRKHK